LIEPVPEVSLVHRYDAAYITQLATRVFGDRAKAAEWLDGPRAQLGGRAPREVLGTADGARRIAELLTQIDDDDRLHTSRQ
jgi:uncharacterized protein (DUF2384 family)